MAAKQYKLVFADGQTPLPAEMRFLDAAGKIDLQAADGKPKTFSGVAYSGGPLRVAGFPHDVYADLRGMRIVRQENAVLRGHKQDLAVGHTTLVAIADNTLTFSGVVSCTGPHVDEVVGRAGFPWQPSIGTTIEAQEKIEPGESATVNGRTIRGPAYIARRTTLREISFVEVGGDADATITLAASAALLGGDRQMETFEKWLADRGHADPSKLLPEVRTKLHASFSAEVARLGGVQHTNNVEELFAKFREEMRTDALVQAKIGMLPTAELKAQAVTERWDHVRIQNETELHTLRAGRAVVTGLPMGGPGTEVPKAIEAALCISAGLPGVEKAFGEKTLDLAHKNFRWLTIGECLLKAAACNGYSLRGGSEIRNDLPGVLKAAFSTNTIGDVLANVATKFLLAGYNSVEMAWRKIARIRPVKDFKQTTAIRLTNSGAWAEIGPAGDLKYGTLGDQPFTNQAKTYGQMLSIPRPDLINDDLNALSDVPRLLGRGGGLKLNLVFWTAWLNDSAFFAAGNKNYINGSTTNLTSTSLTTMRKTFMSQTDNDGNPLGAMAKFLVVGQSNYDNAIGLMNSDFFIAGGDTTVGKVPAKNTFVGSFEPVVSTYLENANITGNSTTGYYLVADPADGAAIEVVFLNGNEVPTVEQADADFAQLGIQMRAYFDFGVNLQDYRYAVKSKGAA